MKYINEETYIDNIGGTHSEGLGWDPKGFFYGECSIGDCETCKVWNRRQTGLQDIMDEPQC